MSRLLIHGKLYEPIKVGDEGDWYFGEPGATCGDCGEAYGKQHLPQCDVERCPLCGGQLLSCDCGPVYDVEDDMSDDDIEQLKLNQLHELMKQGTSYSTTPKVRTGTFTKSWARQKRL